MDQKELLRWKRSICDEVRKAYTEYDLTEFAKRCVDSLIRHMESSDEAFFVSDLQAGTLSIFGRFVQSVVEECPRKAGL